MLVVDASFVAAAFAEETHTDFARETMDRFLGEGFRAPALIRWELASIFWKKARRGEVDTEDMDDLSRYIDALNVSHPDLPDGAAISELAGFAQQHGLSVYDAAYLALAMGCDEALATNDRGLTTAAIAAGVTVYSPFG